MARRRGAGPRLPITTAVITLDRVHVHLLILHHLPAGARQRHCVNAMALPAPILPGGGARRVVDDGQPRLLGKFRGLRFRFLEEVVHGHGDAVEAGQQDKQVQGDQHLANALVAALRDGRAGRRLAQAVDEDQEDQALRAGGQVVVLVGHVRPVDEEAEHEQRRQEHAKGLLAHGAADEEHRNGGQHHAARTLKDLEPPVLWLIGLEQEAEGADARDAGVGGALVERHAQHLDAVAQREPMEQRAPEALALAP
mmetsp:Transcript_41872/g.131265  ORF Transcript_41872/g.131265 Transcript_41872/m.131265 type:complete len:253 (+) Transcript_41872:123-881(+)